MVVPVARNCVLFNGLSVKMRRNCAFAPGASPNTATTRDSVVRNRLSMVSNLRRIGNLGCERRALRRRRPLFSRPRPIRESGFETRNLGFFLCYYAERDACFGSCVSPSVYHPLWIDEIPRPCGASSREAARGRRGLAASSSLTAFRRSYFKIVIVFLKTPSAVVPRTK